MNAAEVIVSDVAPIVSAAVQPEPANDDSLLAKMDRAEKLLPPDAWARLLNAA